MKIEDEIEAAKKFMNLVGPEETAKFIANMQIAIDGLSVHNRQFRQAFINNHVVVDSEEMQELKAVIAIIARRCELAPMSMRHHLISDVDLERLLEISAT